jgi:hypothetical protein
VSPVVRKDNSKAKARELVSKAKAAEGAQDIPKALRLYRKALQVAPDSTSLPKKISKLEVLVTSNSAVNSVASVEAVRTSH